MSVSCRVDKPPFMETCLVTIINVATCCKLVCWHVSNVTMPRVTDDDTHRQHTCFVLASHMSCHGILPICDQDWLPVTVSATLKMSSKIWLWHVLGWHVAKILMTFPTKAMIFIDTRCANKNIESAFVGFMRIMGLKQRAVQLLSYVASLINPSHIPITFGMEKSK